MYRKALLASGGTGTEGLKEEGETFIEVEGIENWISRTQETISSIRKGVKRDCTFMILIAIYTMYTLNVLTITSMPPCIGSEL